MSAAINLDGNYQARESLDAFSGMVADYGGELLPGREWLDAAGPRVLALAEAAPGPAGRFEFYSGVAAGGAARILPILRGVMAGIEADQDAREAGRAPCPSGPGARERIRRAAEARASAAAERLREGALGELAELPLDGRSARGLVAAARACLANAEAIRASEIDVLSVAHDMGEAKPGEGRRPARARLLSARLFGREAAAAHAAAAAANRLVFEGAVRALRLYLGAAPSPAPAAGRRREWEWAS